MRPFETTEASFVVSSLNHFIVESAFDATFVQMELLSNLVDSAVVRAVNPNILSKVALSVAGAAKRVEAKMSTVLAEVAIAGKSVITNGVVNAV